MTDGVDQRKPTTTADTERLPIAFDRKLAPRSHRNFRGFIAASRTRLKRNELDREQLRRSLATRFLALAGSSAGGGISALLADLLSTGSVGAMG